MTRRFALVTVSLTASVGFLIGLVVAGSLTPQAAISAPSVPEVRVRAAAPLPPPDLGSSTTSFADVAEALNPAVVSIDATTRGSRRFRPLPSLPVPDSPDLFGRPRERERDPGEPRRGAGTGFVFDPSGLILTNHHVVDGADRIMVRLTDGRSLHATVVGSDADTDVAVIRVSSAKPLPAATLGNSDALRVGEWVCAIGNPLAYEHTVTVGVVSYIGRKLFDSSLDRYIQTDAAISFGNSGGPLVNSRGEVIGINAAVSSRAANIGFAVPINQARSILPQLLEKGRVARGFIGVALRDVDPDLRRSLGLPSTPGALVEDVTPGAPGARAGLRAYDLIVALDGKPIAGHDELIRRIAEREPGSIATVQVLRDARPLTLSLKLAERPQRDNDDVQSAFDRRPAVPSQPVTGVTVRELDPDWARRLRLPDGMRGLVIVRVDPLSPGFDAELERGQVLLEINRRPVRSLDEYRNMTATLHAGDVATFYVYQPQDQQRMLHTLRIE